jgi:micrococcal nuclease
MYEYSARVTKIVDGDTVHLEIDLGLDTQRKIVCRLARINAPEMSTAEGLAAKQYLAALLGPDMIGGVTVRTIKDRKERYGRYLVEIEGSHGNVSDAMVKGGMAVLYQAKARN